MLNASSTSQIVEQYRTRASIKVHLGILLRAIKDPATQRKPQQIVKEIEAGGTRSRVYKPYANASLPILAAALSKWKGNIAWSKRQIKQVYSVALVQR